MAITETPAGRLGSLLIGRKWRVGVAESCSGGLISHLLTNVPGSSAYFAGGLAAYSNEVKIGILGVPRGIVIKHGAVSAQTAKSMAERARKIFGADIALSATGIAGPGGGTKDKPVGLVYIAVAVRGLGVTVRRCRFNGGRLAVKNKTAVTAIEMAVKVLQIARTGRKRKVRA